jgi:hypothetical protein
LNGGPGGARGHGGRGESGSDAFFAGLNGPNGGANLAARPAGRTDNDLDGWAVEEGDCDDDNQFIFPGAPIFCPGVTTGGEDRDCNGIDDFFDCNSSPIIIDLGGKGLDLTDAKGGVRFDLDGDGAAEQLSWTASGVDDAFLCFDRNGNGVVDNGRELFGNYTPLDNGRLAQNGFEALAIYDLPARGGNGNYALDAADAIYSQLRLWRDSNHNGLSEPQELQTLEQARIASIALDYRFSRKKDRFGNEFRYSARVFLTGEKKLFVEGRLAVDVFLLRGV